MEKPTQYWGENKNQRTDTIWLQSHQTSSLSNQDRVLLVNGRQSDQWNRIERPEMVPHKYSQLIFDKGAMAIVWRKDSLSTNSAETTRHPHEKNESKHWFYTFHKKKNSQWIIDLNIKH